MDLDAEIKIAEEISLACKRVARNIGHDDSVHDGILADHVVELRYIKTNERGSEKIGDILANDRDLQNALQIAKEKHNGR